jgi:hypothetical protein
VTGSKTIIKELDCVFSVVVDEEEVVEDEEEAIERALQRTLKKK